MHALAAGSALALLAGGIATAQPTSNVVAGLVTSFCMPLIQSGASQPANAPHGGRALTGAEQAQYDRTHDIAAWRYQTDDDFVVVHIRRDTACDVETGATGGPDFLPVLRRAVVKRYAHLDEIDIQPPNPEPHLGYVTYYVALPGGARAGGAPAEALVITYPKAGAPAQHRTFYVGVIPATRKPN